MIAGLVEWWLGVTRTPGFSHVVRGGPGSALGAAMVDSLLHGPAGRWVLLCPTGRWVLLAGPLLMESDHLASHSRPSPLVDKA